MTTLATFDSAPYDVVFKLMLHLTDFYALMLNDFIIKSNCRRRRRQRRGSLWPGSGGVGSCLPRGLSDTNRTPNHPLLLHKKGRIQDE